MPHYYLNLFNSADTIDREGRDFPDLSAAEEEAIRSARELMAEHLIAGSPIDLNHRIEVADADGKVLATIDFRELVTITDSRNRA
jgi:hypothetical protein